MQVQERTTSMPEFAQERTGPTAMGPLAQTLPLLRCLALTWERLETRTQLRALYDEVDRLSRAFELE